MHHCPCFSSFRAPSASLSCAGKLQDLLMALEKFRLGLEEALDDTLHELARLVLELSLGWAEDLLKDADELGCEALYGRLVGFV